MNKNYIALVALVLVGFLGYFIFKNTNSNKTLEKNIPTENNSASQNQPVENTSTQNTNTSKDTSSTTKEFTVIGTNFSFAPNKIEVNKGDTVKINFQNNDGMHNLIIDEFNVGTAVIGTGKTQTITFVAGKTGSFEYYCSVGSHRAMGMKGTLLVK